MSAAMTEDVAQLNTSADRKDGLSYAAVASIHVDEPTGGHETHEVKKLITEFETAAKEQKLACDTEHAGHKEANADKKKKKKKDKSGKNASANETKSSRISGVFRRCLPCFYREPTNGASDAIPVGSDAANSSQEARE